MRALIVMLALNVPGPVIAEQATAGRSEPNQAAGEGSRAADARGVAALDEITVTAIKVPTPLDAIAGSVSVISSAAAERQVAQDIKDLVRYEPGVTVRDQGSRFGLAGFTVRGLGGDRVAIEIDGVAVPESFSIGSFSNASRDFVDIDLLKRTEIIRGPASSIYGSDALGGVVSFVSKDPADYVARSGGSSRFGVKTQFAGADDSFAGTAVAAHNGAALGASLAYVRREGNEVNRPGDNQSTGAVRTAADPTDYRSDSAISKLVVNDGALAGLELTLDGTRTRSTTQSLSSLNAVTSRLQGDDEADRLRSSVEWAREDGLGPCEFLDARLYWQTSQTRQDTDEARVASVMGVVTPQQRKRRFEFGQEQAGGEVVAQEHWSWGGVQHIVTTGLEIEHTRTTQLRDGSQTNLVTGVTTPAVPPDTFPVRDFPRTRTLEAGLFVQDEIRFGAITLVPGVRFDYLDLDPEPDAIFVADNPGVMASGLRAASVSPKFGVLWALRPRLNAFAQYARGFRAPPFDDVNIGFTNLAFGYTAIANPDLEPEISDGFELGLRSSGDRARFQLSAYYNRYHQFIESLSNLGVDPGTGLITFQSRNVAEATIHGAEAGASVQLDAVLPGLLLRGALSWARGKDETAGLALDTIDPLRLVAGIAFAPEHDRWGVELVGAATERKTRSHDVPAGLGAPQPQFEPPASYVFDLLAHWRVRDSTQLRLAVYNLADRTYWDWQDVRGRLASDQALERYARPGRTVNASFEIQW